MRKKLITAVLLSLILVLTLGVTAFAGEVEETTAEVEVITEPVDAAPKELVEAETEESDMEDIVDSDAKEDEETVEPEAEEEPIEPAAEEQNIKEEPVPKEKVDGAVVEEAEQPADDTSANSTTTGGLYSIEFIRTTEEGEKTARFNGGSEEGISVKEILTGLGLEINSDSQIDVLEDSVDTEVIGLRRTDNGIFIIDNGMFSKASKDLIITVNGEEIQVSVFDGIKYLYPVYKTAYDPASGISKWEEGEENATRITGDMSEWGVESQETWYFVDSNVTITSGVTCKGSVHLILADGCNLKITGSDNEAGICVSGNNRLTIYGQKDGTGKLEATGGSSGAGIGGGSSEVGSNITINGGTITANGRTSAAGIGGGNGGDGRDITINGGTIAATGDGGGGAGIGGGISGDGSNITINGGTVNATSSGLGAGIGGGSGKAGSYITINGGVVTANGDAGAAGIGGGNKGNGSNITINGGTVSANVLHGNGSAIGNGAQCTPLASNIKVATTLGLKADNGNPPTTLIDNDGGDLAGVLAGKRYATVKLYERVEYIDADGTTKYIGADSTVAKTYTTVVSISTSEPVIWTAGWYVVNGGAGAPAVEISAQLTYVEGKVNLILADGCNLKVSSQEGFPGIFVTNTDPVNPENTFTVYGQSTGTGKLEAKGGSNGAGIGGSNQEVGSNITINGGIVIATGGTCAAGIGGGNGGDGSYITINGGSVTATGGTGAAGIGGGNGGDGSNITINGGTVTSNGDGDGAGIGGGYQKSGSYITINGGTVDATGGSVGGAGIGSGGGGSMHGAGSNITINGGMVTANGGPAASAIGNGKECTDSANIKVATTLIVLVGTTQTLKSTDAVQLDRISTTDIASDLNGKRYARIKPGFKVSFDTDSGSSVNPQGVFTGETAVKPDDPTKTGKVFAGWYKADKMSKWNFDTDTITEATIIYAKWGKDSITLTAASDTKVYDGTALSASGFTFTDGILIEGDVLTATVEGSITDVGTAENKVKADSIKVTRNGVDVTGEYQFDTPVDGTLTVTARQVTVSGTRAKDKTYDGTTSAEVVIGDVIGLISRDKVAVTSTAFFDDPEVGENKNVTVTYSLKGEGSGNYNLKSDLEVLKAAIKDPPEPAPAPSGGNTEDDGLIVKEIETNTLTEAQAKAVEKALEEKGITLVNVLNVSKKNADKEHFTATITIESKYFEGYDPSTLKVWKVNDDNTLTLVPFTVVNGKIIINNGKLGNYIITVD